MSQHRVIVSGSTEGRQAEILSDDAALAFVAELHHAFEPRRRELLARRAERRRRLRDGELPDFLHETREVRHGDWQVAPTPPDLLDRRVEITGPTHRKMIINGLNSGARTFMADLEDSNTPSWRNVIDGQVNLADAVRRTIRLETDAKTYELGPDPAVLLVRPRGWHLDEPRIQVDGEVASGSLVDVGLYLFHNHAALHERGTGPYLYLPKLENHLEARLWNEVFVHAQDRLGMEQGTIRATVLIEHILAAFEMEEILYELRDHAAGLNAGRWDYIFSLVKSFPNHPEFVLPDRARVTMTVPFMHAYTELLVRTCHRRGAHAMGGMAAFIPNRRDPEVTERALAAVEADKRREAEAGFDGTWVAHPDLVEVAREQFDAVLGDRPHQRDRQREDVEVAASDLLDLRVPDGAITEQGVRTNVRVGILYLESWLRGNGAAALFDLMEDAATAEISRSQLWQWVHHRAQLDDGRTVTPELVVEVVGQEMATIRDLVGDDAFTAGRFDTARELFTQVALGEELVEFLTIPAMGELEEAQRV